MKNKIITFWIILAAVLLISAETHSQVTQEWVQRYNGSGNGQDFMADMFTDGSGNSYICGLAFRSETNTNDLVIAKYNSAGALQWRSFYDAGAGGADAAAGVAVDNTGNVYVIGRSQSAASGFDVITLKYNTSGALVWQRRLDGAAHQDDRGTDITIDGAGNICITGSVNVGLFAGFTDILIAKYDPNGNPVFTPANYNFSGDAIDIGFAITTDASNNIYVTGTWGSQVTPGSINSQFTTISLSPSGTARWIKQYGDPLGLPIEAYDIKVDNAGNILVAGKVQSTANGQYQAAIVKYNSSNGNEIWARRFTNPGSIEDIPIRMAVDDSNNVYITGYTFLANNRDIATVKYTAAGAFSWIASYNFSPTNSADEGLDIIVRGRWVYISGYITGPVQKDYVVFKYDRHNGAQMWGSSYFGPVSGDDAALRIGLDNTQNVYLGGHSYGGTTTNFDWALVKFTQTPPAAPTLITPANNAVNIPLTAALDWSDVTGAIDYQLQVSTSSSFTTTVISIGTLTASQYAVPAGVLSSGTQYYWRVTVRTPNGFSSFAGPWSFTTVPVAPSAPVLVSPANAATGVALAPTLNWNDVTGAATYNVQVSTSSTFGTTVVNQTGLTASQFSVPSGILQTNTVYYWRAAAVNGGGTSPYSTVWSFTTSVNPPAAPTLAAPVNGATGVALNAALNWNDVTGAATYNLQVSTSSTFTTTVINQTGLTASQYTVPAGTLQNNVVYYWRAAAVNAGGTSPYSAVWNFTTIISAPAAPVLVSPANGTVGTTLTPLLNWNDVTGAATYNLQVSTSSTFGTTVVNQTGLTASQYTVPAGVLQNNVTYYWRASAVNAGGTGPYSAVWNFKPLQTGIFQELSEIPTEFKLYDNYPNPFNPSTNIKFALPEGGTVSVKIYDALGKEVAVLVNQSLEAGVYIAKWDASSYSSGIYFFILHTENFRDTKRMLLIK